MPELSAEVTLRPTRIGFLTSPTDMAAVRAIMRACTCIWGGCYNPIIPVFKRTPDEWKVGVSNRYKGPEIAKGYVRFFEPDVYVETRKGLLEEAGLGAFRDQTSFRTLVIPFEEFLKARDGRKWAEPKFGLNICDVLQHAYEKEQQFVRRELKKNIYIAPNRSDGAVEAMFGVYPHAASTKYIKQTYFDAYKPDVVEPTSQTWRDVYLHGAQTPLRTTRYGVEPERYWHHDLIIFVFDPTRATDLIDLWNLRLEPRPVLPIPIDWFGELKDDIHRILKNEHRPVVGSPHGLMHKATIEFARSLSQARTAELLESLKDKLPQGALVVKNWRNAIWEERRDNLSHRNYRMKLIVKERQTQLVLKTEGQSMRAAFDPLEPDFALPHADADHRWVNVLRISNYFDLDVATVLPFNTFTPQWPDLGVLGEGSPIGREGWVFKQTFKNLGQHVALLSKKEAIVGALSSKGIEATLSEPGHIARQMLEQLGGLRGLRILADIGTLKLLNKMAGGLRRKNNEYDSIEESYELRTATLKEWTDLIAKRKSHRSLRHQGLSDFTKGNVIKLGIETDCPHCNVKNWSSLTSVDYSVACDRCLKQYEFPQAALRKNNGNFSYRVIGPFSTPDYGRGSYGALLTLRVLSGYRISLGGAITFSPAMNLSFDGKKSEVDFVALQSEDSGAHSPALPPRLIIGEAKSLAQGELITSQDLRKLMLVSKKLPDAIVVISVLRDHFTQTETKLLRKFVSWGRKVNISGEPTNPVILLTACELMMDIGISEEWRKIGGKHAEFSKFDNVRSLLDLADATQQIYLNLPSFHDERHEYFERRNLTSKTKKN